MHKLISRFLWVSFYGTVNDTTFLHSSDIKLICMVWFKKPLTLHYSKTNIFTFFSYLYKLCVYRNLSGNSISGGIPSSLGSIPRLEILWVNFTPLLVWFEIYFFSFSPMKCKEEWWSLNLLIFVDILCKVDNGRCCSCHVVFFFTPFQATKSSGLKRMNDLQNNSLNYACLIGFLVYKTWNMFKFLSSCWNSKIKV